MLFRSNWKAAFVSIVTFACALPAFADVTVSNAWIRSTVPGQKVAGAFMTQHAITIRPICFSGKTFKKLPPDLQAAILKAGKEAGQYGRQIESSEDSKKLDAMEAAGKLKKIPFADRAAMKKAADPVMAEYAKEIGAEAIYNKINSM